MKFTFWQTNENKLLKQKAHLIPNSPLGNDGRVVIIKQIKNQYLKVIRITKTKGYPDITKFQHLLFYIHHTSLK